MVIGVKANDYNATYEEVALNIIERDKVYEIREVNSGMALFIDKGAFNDNSRSQKGTVGSKGTAKGH